MNIKATDIYISKSTEQIDVFRRSDLKYTQISKSSNSDEIGKVVHSGLYEIEYNGINWESPDKYNKIKDKDWEYVVVVIEMENNTYVTTPHWSYEKAPNIFIKNTSDFNEIGNAVIKTIDFCKKVIKENRHPKK
ncbi:hypothetical protein [Costertonia aggregata]|uniref:Uncharacterized protein n=1 Tax=Costertonia aggregata TaxID=343403 RepID=A0A7H9APC2_9FLAO|nr:hypothetical protein [Costertonia aggregata]QLG45309.1 hypothetical protein HYG79_08095 [Costertonia aggregata]